MESMKKYMLLIVFLNTLGFAVSAQQNKVYKEMTLGELLNIDVAVTASKKPEDLFEAPLSTTIIKKQDIEESGATSIPEALRLAQGVIVREITPGNYDVHIRGYDDITKNVYLKQPYNTTTLVMIDNRVVYSYFSGGTLWETFPVDLNDVERIEIVRGPASALYGPNAVTGVINIITSHANKQGVNISATGRLGTNNAKNANVNIGYNWNDKTKLSFSGNFTERRRFDDAYFDFNKKDYTDIDNLTLTVTPIKNLNTFEDWTFSEIQEAMGSDYDEDLSLRKIGGNVFFLHNFTEQTNIDIAIGAQKSISQKAGYLNLSTVLSEFESKSYYLNSRFKHRNFYGQFNINSGQDFSNYKFNSYKFTNIEGNIEYFKQFKTLSIRPGIGYKYLSYNSPLTYDEPFSFNEFDYQFKDDEARTASVYSAFLLSEWKATPKLRMIGAIRIDKFNINKNYFANYEIASTFRINKNNLIRAVYSRANKSPFFFDSYLNASLYIKDSFEVEDENISFEIPISNSIKGSEDLKYPTITNQEIGWRTKINSNFNLDVEVFYSQVKNFVNPNAYINNKLVQQLSALGEQQAILSVETESNVLFENYDLDAEQIGVGFTLNYNVSDKFKATVFGTFQKTNISGRKNVEYTVVNNTNTVSVDNVLTSETNAVVNPIEWSNEITPSMFGGFTMNYRPTTKWNFNTNAYIYSEQQFDDFNYYSLLDQSASDDGFTKMKIDANVVLNSMVSYQINKNIRANITVKNIFGDHTEYGFADTIGRQFLIGINWEL